MKWDPSWDISILADFRPIRYKLSCCDSLWSRYYVGKNLLFKSVLGHCEQYCTRHVSQCRLKDCHVSCLKVKTKGRVGCCFEFYRNFDRNSRRRYLDFYFVSLDQFDWFGQNLKVSKVRKSHGSYDLNLGSKRLILARIIRSRSWPNIRVSQNVQTRKLMLATSFSG